jgi:hypothetical protein
MAEKDKRMADNYEIIREIRVGKREVVFGVNENEEMPFLCAYYTSDGIFGCYDGCVVGDDYLEMSEMFLNRVQEQINEIRREFGEFTEEQKKMIPAGHCISRNEVEDMTGQIVALSPKSLRPEYWNSVSQACFVMHGNGTRRNGHGNSVFVKDLYTGEMSRYERQDIIGVIKPEFAHGWMKERLAEITAQDKGGQEQNAEINEGYRIIDKIKVGDNAFALGKSETSEQYVTWKCGKDKSRGYFWGHYFSNEADARKDLVERAANARENSRKSAESKDARHKTAEEREDR